MKFYICTVSFESENPEQVIQEYPVLKDYGFGIETSTVIREAFKPDERGYWQDTEETETIHRAYITIDTIDELMKLIGAIGYSVIVHTYDDRWELEIYDGYRE